MARFGAVAARSRWILSYAVAPPQRAVAYLDQRGVRSPELIEHMRIGYAPGGCLRGWLTQLGHSLQSSVKLAWLLPPATTPTRIALSSRWKKTSMAAACLRRHHHIVSCRAPRVALYSWDQARLYPEVILVEGCFDYAALWQAGFHNVTCSLGQSQYAPVSPTVRRPANRLSGL